MPAAQYDRLLRVELLGRVRDLHRLLDHRTCDQRNCQAEGVIEFLHHSLFEIRCDGRIDDADLITRLEQRGGHGQNTQGSRSFLARKCGEKEYDLFGSHEVYAFSTALKTPHSSSPLDRASCKVRQPPAGAGNTFAKISRRVP